MCKPRLLQSTQNSKHFGAIYCSYDRIPKGLPEKGWNLPITSSPSKLVLLSHLGICEQWSTKTAPESRVVVMYTRKVFDPVFNVYKMARCKHVYVNTVYSLRKRKQLSLPAQVSV